MARIIRSPQAENDLYDIALYIAEDNLPAALRLIDEVDRRLKLASDSPLSGRRGRPQIAQISQMRKRTPVEAATAGTRTATRLPAVFACTCRWAFFIPRPRTDSHFLVPTLRVGTLCGRSAPPPVVPMRFLPAQESQPRGASGEHSHAERGNEKAQGDRQPISWLRIIEAYEEQTGEPHLVAKTMIQMCGDSAR